MCIRDRSIVAESPGIVTEALEYIFKKYGNIKVKNVVFYPKDERIQWRISLLKKVLKKRYSFVESKFYKLPIEDINEKNLRKFENFLKKTLKKFSNIIFNISGGRKIMVILVYNYLVKKLKNVKIIDIISYLSREEIGTLEDVLKEKFENGIELSEEEIRKYFFSDNKYKVIEIKV